MYVFSLKYLCVGLFQRSIKMFAVIFLKSMTRSGQINSFMTFLEKSFFPSSDLISYSGSSSSQASVNLRRSWSCALVTLPAVAVQTVRGATGSTTDGAGVVGVLGVWLMSVCSTSLFFYSSLFLLCLRVDESSVQCLSLVVSASCNSFPLCRIHVD